MIRLSPLLLLCACAAGAAFADGGFISREPRSVSEPSQKALIVHQNGIEDLILQVKYSGATQDFAWVVPTPARPVPGQCSRRVFSDLVALTEPKAGGGGFGGGVGGSFGGGVTVLERTHVGVFDVSVLDAGDSRALLAWLNRNGYPVSPRVGAILEDYISRRWYFTAMRVDPRRVESASKDVPGRLDAWELHPIRLTFPTPAPVYPLKISSMNGGISELLIFVAADAPVASRGFAVQYREQVSAEVMNRITQGQPSVKGPLWLTRLWRRMPTAAMTRDLQFR